MLPFGLPEGPIVLEVFVGNLFRYEPGSTQEVERKSNNQQMVLLPGKTTWD
jgi:hypothetical protein